MYDLPDDILIEIFTCADFPSIIALRQTCRRLYTLSKTPTIWLDAYRWISQDAALPTSATTPDVEAKVTRLVRFERNWSSNRPTPRHISYFHAQESSRTAFLPGGRWFLATTLDKSGRVLYWDFDSATEQIEEKVLLECPLGDKDAWAMTFAVDWTESVPGGRYAFDLALEFASPDQFFVSSREPRVMSVWRISSTDDGGLTAKVLRVFPVYRRTPVQQSLSLSGDWLLRLSYSQASAPVLTVHRWRGQREGEITDYILLPREGHEPLENVSLLPDLRVVTVSQSRVSLYAPASTPWKPSPTIPYTIPRSSPLWSFEYPAPHRLLQLSVSRMVIPLPIRCPDTASGPAATFAVHNGETLFSFRIPLGVGDRALPNSEDKNCLPDECPIAEPEVSSTALRPMTGLEFMCLGSNAHTIRSSSNTNAAIFATFPQHSPFVRALRSFAGAAVEEDRPAEETASDSCGSWVVQGGGVKTRFFAPFQPGAGRWMVDERSGRVVCWTRQRRWAVLYFA